MRAIVDANVLISMVLSPSGPVGTILHAIASESFQVLLSEQTLDEVRQSCADKPYLAQRISKRRLDAFLEAIVAAAILLPQLDRQIEPFTPDPKDDYLIAHAIADHADVLVSGDRHLLNEKGRFAFQILSPAEFVALLANSD